jgi:hypothetical protein
VIKLKKKEFQNLKQGSMMVNEYVTRFTPNFVTIPRMMWTLTRRNKVVFSMGSMIVWLIHWRHETLEISRIWLTWHWCSKPTEVSWNASKSKSARVRVVTTLGPG